MAKVADDEILYSDNETAPLVDPKDDALGQERIHKRPARPPPD